jgi:hypothetical protein
MPGAIPLEIGGPRTPLPSHPARRSIPRCRATPASRSILRFRATPITKEISKMSSSPTTVRFLGPKANAATLTFNGRSYSVAAASTIDVPTMDAQICAANGWVQSGSGSGTTAQRPSKPYIGQIYLDTTLAYAVVWEGAAWRNPATAAAV